MEENNTLSRKFKIGMSVTTLFAILFSFNQCVLKPASGSKVSSSKYGSTALPAPSTGDAGDVDTTKDLPAGMDMPPMNSPTDSDLASIEVGVKNFEQINNTMSTLTGVPTTDATIANVYNDIAIQLPSDNNVKNFLPSMQVAITKLATEYCDRTVETDAYRTKIWTTVNFNNGPSTAFTPTVKATMINETVDKFFGPIDAAQIDKAKTELLALYDMLMSGESTTSNATTKKVVKGLCVASLSSAYISLL
jgi:hypothetical protein